MNIFSKFISAKKCLLLAAVTAALQPVVWAHDMHASCRGKAQIRCTGKFSDGSNLAGATVRVLSYEDVVQWAGKVDASGQVVFKRPAGKFYVQFIAPDGHLAEVDHAAIKH